MKSRSINTLELDGVSFTRAPKPLHPSDAGEGWVRGHDCVVCTTPGNTRRSTLARKPPLSSRLSPRPSPFSSGRAWGRRLARLWRHRGMRETSAAGHPIRRFREVPMPHRVPMQRASRVCCCGYAAPGSVARACARAIARMIADNRIQVFTRDKARCVRQSLPRLPWMVR